MKNKMVGSSSKEIKRENLRNTLFNGFKYSAKSYNDSGSVIDLGFL